MSLLIVDGKKFEALLQRPREAVNRLWNGSLDRRAIGALTHSRCSLRRWRHGFSLQEPCHASALQGPKPRATGLRRRAPRHPLGLRRRGRAVGRYDGRLSVLRRALASGSEPFTDGVQPTFHSAGNVSKLRVVVRRFRGDAILCG
jgi:hypothetical protein